MIWPAIATASITSARNIQSCSPIWKAPTVASPERAATAPQRTKAAISDAGADEEEPPDREEAPRQRGHDTAEPGPTRRRTSTASATPMQVWATAVPQAEPRMPRSKP